MNSPPTVTVPEEIAGVTLEQLFILITFVLALMALAIWVRKLTKPILDSIRNFLADWNGEPERPGVERRAGVMERLESLESRLQEVIEEVKPNHGSSMHDMIRSIADKQKEDKK